MVFWQAVAVFVWSALSLYIEPGTATASWALDELVLFMCKKVWEKSEKLLKFTWSTLCSSEISWIFYFHSVLFSPPSCWLEAFRFNVLFLLLLLWGFGLVWFFWLNHVQWNVINFANQSSFDQKVLYRGYIPAWWDQISVWKCYIPDCVHSLCVWFCLVK